MFPPRMTQGGKISTVTNKSRSITPTMGIRRLSALAALAAASAFQRQPAHRPPSSKTARERATTPSGDGPTAVVHRPPVHRPPTALMAHHRMRRRWSPGPPDVVHHHHHYYPPPMPPPSMDGRGSYRGDSAQAGYRRGSALDAEVVIEAETLDDEEEDGEGSDSSYYEDDGEYDEDDYDWTTDRQRSRRGRRGEVVDFDPDGPAFRPLRNAAATPADLRDDDNKFQGRRPGQAVNARRGRRRGNGGGGGPAEFDEFIVNAGNRSNAMAGDGMGMGDNMGLPPMPPPMPPPMDMDERERHILIDGMDYMSEFLPPPIPPGGRPTLQTPRPGSAYTPEEEDLIDAMGGRGPPGIGSQSTQEFAGLGTMTRSARGGRRGGGEASMQYNASRAGGGDPQRLNYNPEQRFDGPPPMRRPPGPGPVGVGLREEGYLGDSTLREISMDYGVPIPYLADVVAGWGVPVPIDPLARLGDMVTGEQAFAVLEAVHTLDVAGLHARYSEDTLADICDCYDIDMRDAFEFAVGRGWSLPFGVRTFLRVEQEDELIEVLG